MSENSYKSIRNGIIVSVISGSILLAIPVIRGYVSSLFKWLWSCIIWSWSAVTEFYALPGWAWIIIFLLAIIGIVNIYVAINKNNKPECRLYVEDIIFGARWRWEWVGDSLYGLWCYCPTCDATLVYDDSSCRSRRSNVNQTDFICENCQRRVVASVTGGDNNYARGAAEREIRRRIRTGEYKKYL